MGDGEPGKAQQAIPEGPCLYPAPTNKEGPELSATLRVSYPQTSCVFPYDLPSFLCFIKKHRAMLASVLIPPYSEDLTEANRFVPLPSPLKCTT